MTCQHIAGDRNHNIRCRGYLRITIELQLHCNFVRSNYWKNLCIDYKEVAVETVESARQKPVKALLICSGLAFIAYCAHSNPDEQNFRDKFLFHTNEMILVGEPIRNPQAVSHLKFLETCYNKGVIRTLGLGIINFMWISDYDKSSGLYQAHCEYLEPKFLTFHKRIVDIGFLGQWWILQRTMKDFDINPSEFENLQNT
ncbi:mitochondrial import inner membrane translocase subunit Tim29 isoform X2 [Cryptotermes secundus]|uniref:mitochondrial import inner membrane translocase subunit Tim29 isoform X2 n=1 Tax=Cryptotermes secundus TaxID=105785 RepID=UPI000CD7B027|nr:mitochondrial import inner membrane translocase subunit Tim29 isoform X2 [Cryptotermes secundus]